MPVEHLYEFFLFSAISDENYRSPKKEARLTLKNRVHSEREPKLHLASIVFRATAHGPPKFDLIKKVAISPVRVQKSRHLRLRQRCRRHG